MKKPSYYNNEGYPDPTYYQVAIKLLTEEEQHQKELHAYRPIVYICSPLRGDVNANILNARKFSRFAYKKGFLPLAPHLLFQQFLNDADEDEREIGIYMGLVLLSKCVELWVFGDKVSEGMKREIKKAKMRAVPIRYFTAECKEVYTNDKSI